MIQFVLRFFLVTIAAGFLKACLMLKACIQFHPLAKISQELIYSACLISTWDVYEYSKSIDCVKSEKMSI